MKIIGKIYAEGLGGQLGDESMGIFGGKNFGTTGVLAIGALSQIVSAIIGALTVAAGIWLIFQIITAGISWMTAGGDKSKLQLARDKITNALIGVVIVVAGWAIIALVGQFLGWDNILLDNPNVIENIIKP